MPDTETQEVNTADESTESIDNSENIEVNARKPEFPSAENIPAGEPIGSLSLLLDATMPVSVTLGSGTMPIGRLMNLGPGSVIQLDKRIGEPVDIYVKDVYFAIGDVVVVEDQLGVRIREILSPQTTNDH